MSQLVIDKEWAEKVLGKIGGAAVKPLRGKRKGDDPGYAWHKAAPPQSSQVGSRLKTNPAGLITAMDIAGRPAGKHGGNQGQHTTAFAANREVVVAATTGRDEASARSALALLFETLLRYPAFIDKSQPPPPQELMDLVTQLADDTTPLSKSYSVNYLSTLYLEIRDSLPGSSVDTGVTSGRSTASRNNITGKGEGRVLESLRDLEADALHHRSGGPPLDNGQIEGAATLMLKLYDASAEAAAGMSDEDAHAQQMTFLLTIAQAFPAVFIGAAPLVTKGLNRLKAGDQNVVLEACEELADGNALVESDGMDLDDGDAPDLRPRPKNFIARLNGDSISFVGRSDSIKDSGTMGDHTCSEELMKNAATRVIASSGTATTNKDLADNLQKIEQQFSSDRYRVFDQDVDESEPAYMCKWRFETLKDHLKTVEKLRDRLGANPPMDTATEADKTEAAELYMQLVDDRPTAVNYGAPAAGHGEPSTLAELKLIEANLKSGRSPGTGPQLLQTFIGLLDCQAVFNNANMMFEYADEQGNPKKHEIFDKCIALVADEFMFFVSNAYPLSFGKMQECKPSLFESLTQLILASGSMDRDDDEYEGGGKRRRTK